MTHDLTEYAETVEMQQSTAPPLSLVNYFAEREEHPPERNLHPPGNRIGDHRVERRDNLIIVEFAKPPSKQWQGSCRRKSVLERACDILLALLLLASFLGCIAAFRF